MNYFFYILRRYYGEQCIWLSENVSYGKWSKCYNKFLLYEHFSGKFYNRNNMSDIVVGLILEFKYNFGYYNGAHSEVSLNATNKKIYMTIQTVNLKN